MATFDPLVSATLISNQVYQVAKDGAACTNLAAIAAADAARKLGVQGVISSLLTAVGLYKQYDALGKQGDLFEAQKDVALRNIALAERSFNETFMPSYKAANDYFEKGFRKQWEPILVKVVDCGTKECEYEEDYTRHTSWAVADAEKIVNAAQRSARKVGACSIAGACFNQDYRFAELKSRLVVDAKNLGRAFEDDVKLKKDTFYWNRFTTAATIAQNVGSLASNIMINGKGSLINSLQTINQASTGLDAAVASGFSTLSNQGAFYGGIGASLNGLFNGRDAKADAQALAAQSVSQRLPEPGMFFNRDYQAGTPYTPMGLDIMPARMETRNNSGEVVTNQGFRARPTSPILPTQTTGN